MNLSAAQAALASRPRTRIGFGVCLGWTVAPLLIALLVLTWVRIETRRVQYALAEVAQEESDWSRRSRRAEAEWQALTSRENLHRAAAMLELREARPQQRWSLSK
jgi:hypothetical protein